VTKRSGQRVAKPTAAGGGIAAALAANAVSAGGGQTQAEQDLARMISELNEVRMRLDTIVRKLASSAVEVQDSRETVDDVERLRLRLVGKLDRIREELVTRLGEERTLRQN
jgi:hypothetical protein